MITIKEGEIKDSGSPFKEMTAKEQQVWQDMVDHAYEEFLDVVVAGQGPDQERAAQKTSEIKPINSAPARVPGRPPSRTDAIAPMAASIPPTWPRLDLIDKIGRPRRRHPAPPARPPAGGKFKVVQYEKPQSVCEILLGAKERQPRQRPRSGPRAERADAAGVVSGAGLRDDRYPQRMEED